MEVLERKVKEKEEKILGQDAPLILKKRVTCPVCDAEFRGLAVKSGKARRVGTDIDLRPKNVPIDALKYGVFSCPECGYTAMAKSFADLTSAQRMLIQQEICANFKPRGLDEPDCLSYDEAIMLHKLAILTTTAKRGHESEVAYLCLLITWLYRGKLELIDSVYEELGKSHPDEEEVPKPEVIASQYEAMTAPLKDQMLRFAGQARDKFVKADAEEVPPFSGGLDLQTLEFIIGALSYEIDDLDLALQMCSRTMTSKSSSRQLKDRAYDLKEAINAKKKELGEEGE